MKRSIKFIAAFAPMLLASIAARAQTPIVEIAARVEIRAFQSLTLSDSQFLKGDASGQPVTLAGALRFPRTATGAKIPAVILVHGSGGVSAGVDAWQFALNRLGIATFVIDAFSGRGLTTVSTNQSLLGRFNMTLDTFRAWETLAKHPRIDPERIAVIGYSRGGTAVIYSTLRRFQKQWSPNFKAAATIAMYPSCFDHVDDDEDVVGPIREYHGDIDDYASTKKCEAWIARLKAAGKDVTSTEYKGAAHSFDSPTGVPAPATSVNKGSQSQRDCAVSEKAGELINAATGQPFTYKDAGVALDPHSNYSADATAKTRAEVFALFGEKLKPAGK